MLIQRLLKLYGDDFVKDLVIRRLLQSTEITNEFLSTIWQRDSPENGYEKFHLVNFKGLMTPLEESVIERPKEKLTHVRDFRVAEMDYLRTEVRS